MTTAQQVAEYILWSAHETGSFISNLKLQKLLYYVQAWHLALHGKPLFPEKFQAWAHGPVVRDVYCRYRDYRWRNIDEEVSKPSLGRSTTSFIEQVLDEYGHLDARRLEQLTHDEFPWNFARGSLPDDEPCEHEIDEKVMGDFYRARLEQDELDAWQHEEMEQEAARHEMDLHGITQEDIPDDAMGYSMEEYERETRKSLPQSDELN